MKKLLARLLGISSVLLDFFVPILQSVLANSLEKLLPIALGAVTNLAANGQLGNAEKRAAAFKVIESAAISEGINASASTINFALEAALTKLKASK